MGIGSTVGIATTQPALPHGADFFVHMHVADRDVAKAAIHRDHVATAQDEIAGTRRCGCPQVRRALRGGVGRAGKKTGGARNTEHGAPKKEMPAVLRNVIVAAWTSGSP